MRLFSQFYKLRVRLPLIIGAMLMAGSMIFAIHTSLELREDLENALSKRSLTSAAELANDLSVHLRNNDMAAIHNFIDGAQLSSDAKEIAIYDGHGKQLYSTHAESPGRTPPDTIDPQAVHKPNSINVWVPILGAGLEGWLFVDYRYDALAILDNEFIYHQIKDGAVVAIFVVLAIFLLMRRPLNSIHQAAEFASRLDENLGRTLPETEKDSEINTLVAALNAASNRLLEHKKNDERCDLRLRHAQLVAGLGLWEWDAATKVFYWTDEYYVSHSRNDVALDVIARAYLTKSVHPLDRDRVKLAINKVLITGESSSIDHRIIINGDIVRTVQHNVEATLNELGIIVNLFGTVIDISNRKAIEEELIKKRKQVLNILESTTDGYVSIDNNYDIQYLNSKARQIFAIPDHKGGSKNLWEVIPELASGFYRAIHKAVVEHVPVELEGFYPPSERWLEIHVYPHRSGASIYFRDITEKRSAEQALRSSEEQVSAILDNVMDAIVAVDKSGTIIIFNKAAERIFGYNSEEMIGGPLDILMPEEHANRHQNYMNHYILSGEANVIWAGRELTGKRKNNEVFPLEIELNAIHLGEDPIFIGIVRDLSLRRQTEHNMRMAEHVFSNSIEGIAIISADKNILRVNRSFSEISGFTQEELGGKSVEFLFRSALKGRELLDNVWKIIERQGNWRGEFSSRKGDGSEYTAWSMISATKDSKGAITGYVMVCNDVTQIREAQSRIHRLANFDVLTDLPNRTLLNERLVQRLVRASRRGEKVALLRVDLDRFKTLNETLGHDVGDKLLKDVAARIVSSVRDVDVVARLSGDEFAIMLSTFSRSSDVEAFAKKIMAQFDWPFLVDAREVFITVSIGIALFPDDAHDANDLMKHAGAAMHHVKEHGRNSYRFYSNELDATAFEQLVLENSLRRALERKEFVLFYQPQIDLVKGTVIGVEALIRWNHPDIGMVSPIRFIPLLEETGLILQVGEWVVQEACRQGKLWHDAGYEVKVSVNLSPRQFSQGRQLAQVIQQAIAASGMDPKYLDLEITETSLMDSPDETIALLSEFKSSNINISLDDFGTGYSSLSYLTRFPLDTLKIDRSFIRSALVDQSDAALTTAIITMGRSLNIKVLAEGVETIEQLEFLRRQGCDEVQGFLFSKPVPADEVVGFFDRPLVWYE